MVTSPTAYGPLFYVHPDAHPGGVENGFREGDPEEAQEDGRDRLYRYPKKPGVSGSDSPERR
jgi:hypothetical protein